MGCKEPGRNPDSKILIHFYVTCTVRPQPCPMPTLLPPCDAAWSLSLCLRQKCIQASQNTALMSTKHWRMANWETASEMLWMIRAVIDGVPGSC